MRKLCLEEVEELRNALLSVDCHYPPRRVSWYVCRLRESCRYSGLWNAVYMSPDCYLQFCLGPEYCLPRLCTLMVRAKFRNERGALAYWFQLLFGRRMARDERKAVRTARWALQYYGIVEANFRSCRG